MYALNALSPSKYTELNRAFSEFLSSNKVEMTDRRAVSAYVIGKVVGGSLPVADVNGDNTKADVFRQQHLQGIKTWLGRICEAVTIDHELAITGAFFEWSQRCSVAFPAEPDLAPFNRGLGRYGSEQQTAVIAQICKRYPDLQLGFLISSLLTVKGE